MPLDIITYSKLKHKADLVNGKIPASQLPDEAYDVVEGYLENGVFYEDAEHTAVIVSQARKIYIDRSDDLNAAYICIGGSYVQIFNNGISIEDVIIEDPEAS